VEETYLRNELEGLDNMIAKVSKVKLQSEAFRDALLWDLYGYAGASAEDRRKTKDRLFKALQGAPPVDPKGDDLGSLDAEVSGHNIKQPERFA